MDPRVCDTLIVSDLHLGSEMSRAREATRVLRDHCYRRLILLGDIFADLNFGLGLPKGQSIKTRVR